MSGNADAIVAVTRGGKTAHMLSAFRPAVRIFAVTPDAAIARRFAIYRGVLPLVAEIDPTGLAIERQLRERNLLPAGSAVVFLSVNADLTRSDANSPHPSYLTRWWRPAATPQVELIRPQGPPGGPPSPAPRSISMDRARASIHLSGESVPSGRDHGPHSPAICVIS